LVAGDVVPVVSAAVIAIKVSRPLPDGWRYAPPLTEDEVVARILRICVDPDAVRRQQGAWLLRGAPRGLRAHRAIRVVLDAMRDDPDATVAAITRAPQGD
jgi:hypothetical protein